MDLFQYTGAIIGLKPLGGGGVYAEFNFLYLWRGATHHLRAMNMYLMNILKRYD